MKQRNFLVKFGFILLASCGSGARYDGRGGRTVGREGESIVKTNHLLLLLFVVVVVVTRFRLVPYFSFIANSCRIIQQVFLLAHCKDNGLYLRTLATGTELHCLKGHKSKVRISRFSFYPLLCVPEWRGGREVKVPKMDAVRDRVAQR